jgi:hypothetical protein
MPHRVAYLVITILLLLDDVNHNNRKHLRSRIGESTHSEVKQDDVSNKTDSLDMPWEFDGASEGGGSCQRVRQETLSKFCKLFSRNSIRILYI